MSRLHQHLQDSPCPQPSAACPGQRNGSPVLPCRFVCWLSGSPNMRRSSSPDIIQRKVTKQKFPNLCLSSCLVAFLANLISPTFTEDGPYKGSLMELWWPWFACGPFCWVVDFKFPILRGLVSHHLLVLIIWSTMVVLTIAIFSIGSYP